MLIKPRLRVSDAAKLSELADEALPLHRVFSICDVLLSNTLITGMHERISQSRE